MADQKPNGLFITDDAGNVFTFGPKSSYRPRCRKKT